MLAGERPGSGAAVHTSFRKGKPGGNIISKIASNAILHYYLNIRGGCAK